MNGNTVHLLIKWVVHSLIAWGICICGVANAQTFPAKPIRIVIGFPAGGPLDLHARLLADKLQAVLGQPVLIDYKAGAGGTVGAQDVMKS
ncbi:MAG: tripartite tricarboxylate transporter substrate-binding protein, partial [Betaproteobacteria bacterium]